MLETGQHSRDSLFSLDNMPQELTMTTKPPLPPEAHRRPLSPPLVRRPQPPVSAEVREGRRLTRQCSDQPQHTRHQSPPAWFHPVKSVSPPASILKPATSSGSLSKPPPPPRSPVTRLTSADVRPVSPPPAPLATRATPPPPIIQKPCVPPPPVPVQQPCPVIRSEPHPSSSQQDDDEDSDTDSEIICHHENSVSSGANDDIITMIEHLDDLSLNMSLPSSSSSRSPPRPSSPPPMPLLDKIWKPILRAKKDSGSRPLSVPAFSLFKRKKSESKEDVSRASEDKRPASLQLRPTTPTNLLRPISPPRRGATSHDQQRIRSESECSLPRPEPRVATAGLHTAPSPPPLCLLSRLSADYTTYDDEVASYTENNNIDNNNSNTYNNIVRSESSHSRNTPVPNIKSKIEPKNEVPSWTVEEVSGWVARAGFTDFSPAFTELRVDGDMLLQLTEAEIKDDIGLVNGILRKRFMRELRELKKSADYTSLDGGMMANFLNKISPEYKVYTYNLLQKEVSLDFMQRLSSVDLDDMLRDCGVESSIHRHRIIETVLSLDEDATTISSLGSLSESGFSEPGTDVYISYSQTGGAELASLIKIQLEQRDREMNIVAECHDSGLHDHVLARIRDSRHYVLILGPGGLDTCLKGEAIGRLHMELATALKTGVKLIPVTVDFSWPAMDLFPDDIRALTSFNGVRWIHDYQDACLDKLERFIRGEVSRVSSPFTVRRDSGRSTPLPSSPMILHKVLKNRAISFENVNSSQST